MKKNYIDTNFYKAFVNILKQYRIYYNGFKTDDKRNGLCLEIINIIEKIIKLNIKSYNEIDRSVKLSYANKSMHEFNMLSIYINLIHDIGIINNKQLSVLSEILGNIGYQLENWVNKLSNLCE